MAIEAKKRRFDYARWAPLIALVILFVVSCAISADFRSVRNWTNILRQVSYTGIIALGMTFVIASGGIDLSVGSMTALVGGVAILTLNRVGDGQTAVVAAAGAALLCGAAAGLLNGLVTVKGRIAPFIVTLGTMSVFRSVALYIAQAGEFRAESEAYHEIGTGYALGLPVPALVFLGLAIVFHVILNNTRYGRYVLAVGASEDVARYSAIRVGLVKCVTYVISGISVGVTALLVSSRLNSISSSSEGVMYELDAIAAVVIGGTSMSGGKATVFGTVIGAVILGIINNMLVMMEVSPYLQGTVKGAVIITAVLLQYRRTRGRG